MEQSSRADRNSSASLNPRAHAHSRLHRRKCWVGSQANGPIVPTRSLRRTKENLRNRAPRELAAFVLSRTFASGGYLAGILTRYMSAVGPKLAHSTPNFRAFRLIDHV